MEEYKTYTLDEISKGKGSYGIAASAVPFDSSLYTYLRITDINDDGSLNKSGLTSVDENNASNYLLKPNDIVFARTGNSTGRSYFYDGSDGELVYAGFLIKFSLDESKVNPRIMKYYTHSKPYYDWVRSFDTGGTRGNINAKTYGNMPITLPSRPTQDRIVEILKSLDDKIEVNRRINENLEQQAQALFKSWFVDFEPFKDGEFVESELGMIPKGWRVGTLSEISLFSNKKIETSKLTKENYYSTENMLPNKRGVTAASSLPSTLYTPMCTMGDIIISNIRPYFKKIYYCKENIAGCSSDVLCFVPISEEWSEYLFMALYDDNFFDYMMLGTKGTKMPRGDKKQIMKYPLNIPNLDWLTKFNNIVQPIIQQILNNRDESRRLATLRDTLLPKLMSGELKVNEIEI